MAVKEAEDDARVSKLITQNYDNQPSGKFVIPRLPVVPFIFFLIFLLSFYNTEINE